MPGVAIYKIMRGGKESSNPEVNDEPSDFLFSFFSPFTSMFVKHGVELL